MGFVQIGSLRTDSTTNLQTPILTLLNDCTAQKSLRQLQIVSIYLPSGGALPPDLHWGSTSGLCWGTSIAKRPIVPTMTSEPGYAIAANYTASPAVHSEFKIKYKLAWPSGLTCSIHSSYIALTTHLH